MLEDDGLRHWRQPAALHHTRRLCLWHGRGSRQIVRTNPAHMRPPGFDRTRDVCDRWRQTASSRTDHPLRTENPATLAWGEETPNTVASDTTGEAAESTHPDFDADQEVRRLAETPAPAPIPPEVSPSYGHQPPPLRHLHYATVAAPRIWTRGRIGRIMLPIPVPKNNNQEIAHDSGLIPA